MPLLEIHFSRFLCRCSQFSRSTHTHTHSAVCACLSFLFHFFPFFFIFWFSGFTPNSVQLVTCHATSSCNVVGGCSRPSIIDYGPLYGPRAVLSLIRFLLFPHTCLWPGPGPGINGTRNGNGNVEGAFSLEFQQQQPQQPRQLYGRLIKIKRTVSSFGF